MSCLLHRCQTEDCFRILGVLYIKATNSLDDSALARIQRMVNEAQMSSPDVQQVADKVASWFVPGNLRFVAFSPLVFTLVFCLIVRNFCSRCGCIRDLVFAGLLPFG